MADQMIPPPPPVAVIDPWRANVNQQLADHEERIESVENDAACLRRTEAKVDELQGDMRELTKNVMRVVDREAAREPMQERDLGHMRAELARTGASAGRKWGAAVGASVAGAVAVVSEVWEPFRRLIELLK